MIVRVRWCDGGGGGSGCGVVAFGGWSSGMVVAVDEGRDGGMMGE